MLGIFVKAPWPSFYKKGMKSWEIRSYPTDYRGDVLFIESGSNKTICKMTLIDCIPLSKKRWEMNYEKHRTSCSYENLPYRKGESPAYAWVLDKPFLLSNPPVIQRHNSQPCVELSNSIISTCTLSPITFSPERLACKFIGDTMLLYWMKKDYLALVSIVNLKNNSTQIITAEIDHEEIDYLINQLSAT